MTAAAPVHHADVNVLLRYARAAGIAMLLSIVFGMIGEMYLPGRIVVAGDAAATAANLPGNPMLLRLTFATYPVVGFYGTASMIRGYLIFRSGYLPKVLGALLMIGGAGFFLRSATYILAPSLSSPVLLVPMALAGIPLTFWLLFRGVRVEAIPAAA